MAQAHRMPRRKSVIESVPDQEIAHGISHKVPTPEEVEAYLLQIADAVGLLECRFEYDPTPCELWCKIHRDDSIGYSVQLAPSLFGKPAEFQRQAIVHEMVHPFFFLFDLVASGYPSADDKGLRKQIREAEEYAVDRMAYALAKLVPLPPWC